MALRQLTYNEVVQRIEDWASAHKQLNHFQEGDPWEFNTSGSTEFPAMLLQPQASTTGDKTFTFNFTAYFMDLVDDGERNEREVRSDTQLIALDFTAQLTNSQYEWMFDRSTKSVIPFTERFDSELTGWTIEIALTIPFDYNKCQIPETAINIPTAFRDNEVTITDGNNPLSPIIKTGGEDYTCLSSSGSIDTASCAELNDATDGLTTAQRQLIQHVSPIVTGQTTSYIDEDDGFLEKGRLVGFLTLDCNNSFGNTDRFTDSVGGQIYGAGNSSIADYMIDHATGLGWQFNTGFGVFGTKGLAGAIGDATAEDNGTFSDFRIPNIFEMITLMNFGAEDSLWDYAPITETGSRFLWTSTTNTFSDTRAYNVNTTGNTFINTPGKTSSNHYIYARNHF